MEKDFGSLGFDGSLCHCVVGFFLTVPACCRSNPVVCQLCFQVIVNDLRLFLIVLTVSSISLSMTTLQLSENTWVQAHSSELEADLTFCS